MEKIVLNEELCELIGAFIGDGYFTMTKRKPPRKGNIYCVGIVGNKELDEDYIRNHLLGIINKYFHNTNTCIFYRTDCNAIMLRMHSKEIVNFFQSVGFKTGSKTKTVVIPPLIMNKEEFLRKTIRGIFDTEGCVFLDRRKVYLKPYPRITLQMTSEDLMKQIGDYLSRYFSLYVSESKRANKIRILEIYGHRQVESFLKQIGFSNKRHLDKIAPVA